MKLFAGWNGEIDERGLRRSTRPLAGVHGRTIRLEGRSYLNFASNDYLGLAADSRLRAAARGALEETGWGSGGSRLMAGSHVWHERLEARLAEFKAMPSALVFSSGYLANIGTVPVLAAEGTTLFCDALNHASLIDAARLSKGRVRIYPHNNVDELGRMLRNAGPGRRVVVTDAVFSMDGDFAALDRIYGLLDRDDDLLYVDDAHGTGVVGPEGRGTAALFDLPRDPRIIVMGTLSKALGGVGAFVAGAEGLTDVLRSRARSFIFDTALPPQAAAAGLAALDILEQEGEACRARLRDGCGYLAGGLRRFGFDADTATPIFPVRLGSVKRAVEGARRLEDAGIFAPAIRPPTVAADACRLRISLMATHTRDDLDRLLETLAGLA